MAICLQHTDLCEPAPDEYRIECISGSSMKESGGHGTPDSIISPLSPNSANDTS
jgi:hypothetical protein